VVASVAGCSDDARHNETRAPANADEPRTPGRSTDRDAVHEGPREPADQTPAARHDAPRQPGANADEHPFERAGRKLDDAAARAEENVHEAGEKTAHGIERVGDKIDDAAHRTADDLRDRDDDDDQDK
jgi:hypothetical protein